MVSRLQRQQLLSSFKRVGSARVQPDCGPDTRFLDDDDDIDESALPGFSHPSMRPSTPPLNKGKSRAPEQLALPTGSAPPNQISGNIGTPIGGASRGARQNIGGVQVESRSRTSIPFTPKHGADPPLDPAGLLLLMNRSPQPSSVSFFAHSRSMLTVS